MSVWAVLQALKSIAAEYGSATVPEGEVIFQLLRTPN